MMFKKLLLLTLVACLLFMVVRADECVHLYRTSEYVGSSYHYVDASYHELHENWRQVCVHCGDVASTYYKFGPDPHVFEQDGDWHMEGESVHHYAEACGDCGYTRYWTETCSGANCIKQTIKWRLSR